VVFLSTDDHQNRINELYYSPSGQTGMQSSYVRVPYAFSIVCGPLGATGPETITNHTFSNIKAIADNLAAAQITAGVDPIGLQNYPGLHNLIRSGDPTAGTSPQPVDFYSPDTFNFTVLDVTPNGQTLTVSSIGMNSTGQNVGIEYANGPQANTIFTFKIDGPSLKVLTQGLLDEINNAIETANKKDATRLNEVINSLDKSLDPDRWSTDGNHLVCNGGSQVFEMHHTAIVHLMAMLKDTSPGISDTLIRQWINALLNIDRKLAQISIDESTDAGTISDALSELAKGDSDVANGDYDNAIVHYKAAWRSEGLCSVPGSIK